MKTINLCIDPLKLTSKPEKGSATTKILRKRIAQYEVNVSPLELKNAIEEGRTFAPCTFIGDSALNDDFKSQRIFALDFDNNFSLDQFFQRCKEFNIDPMIVYPTFSHTEENHKFRSLFYFESELTNRNMRKAVQITLMKLFPESDKACKDESRQFLGTDKKVIYFNEETVLTFESLLFAMRLKIIESSQGKRMMKSWLTDISVPEYNGDPMIFMGQIPSAAKKYKDIYTGENFNDGIKRAYDHYHVVFEKSFDINDFSFLDTQEKKVVEFSELIEKCELIDKSLTGEQWLYHSELFGLATNLAKIKGGKGVFEQIAKSRPEYASKSKEIATMYNQTNKVNYAPMRCSNFCPYFGSCKNNGVNILQVTSKAKNNITQIKEINYTSIDDIFASMYDDMSRIINTNCEDGVYLVKAPTGAGKTTAIINILKNSDNKVTFAFPTHRLKDEVSEKMSAECINHLVLREQPKLNDEELSGKINFLNSIGASREVQKIFRNMADASNGEELWGEDFIKVKEYLKAIDFSKEFMENILMTHERVLFATTQNDILVIDEDILLKSMVKIDNTNFSDIEIVMYKVEKKLFEMIDNFDVGQLAVNEKAKDRKESIENTLEYVIKFNTEYLEKIKRSDLNSTHSNFFKFTETMEIMKAIEFLFESKDFLPNEPISNVIKFLGCDFYTIDKDFNINFSTLAGFEQKYKKIIIMSATFNEELYSQVFKNNKVFVRDYGVAKPFDRIQITNKSFSRTTMKNPEVRELAKRLIEEYNPGSDVITYKTFSRTEDIHYGATEGIDTLKGKNITVLGTPHILPDVYNLFYSAVYLEPIKFEDMKFMKVRNDYYEFDLMSYENEKVQNVQKYLIESEIEQAAGRSRDLRTEARTLILSNYPTLSANFLFLPKRELE